LVQRRVSAYVSIKGVCVLASQALPFPGLLPILTLDSSDTMADEEQVFPIPNLALQQHLFELLRPGQSSTSHETARAALLKGIEEDEMAPYYSSIIDSPDPAIAKVLKRDDELLKRLEKKNEETLELMDKQLALNEENEGETEVNTVLRQKAAYLAKIGDKVGRCKPWRE
jgi:26S proteasome regulatory subunit N7